jgi:RimJ/RimL family protein N-acetyltransferase
LERVEPILPIETERLILRPLRADDVEALHAYESREDVARWLYWGPRSADEVRERLERKLGFRSIAAEGDVLSLGITRKGSDALIGDLVLALISEQHRTGEIGFIVHPDQQGQGYATEAGEAVLRIAFEDAGLHRVIGRTEARNVGSARTLEKLGMRLEAHLVENEWVKGEWQSELVYAILEREWRERQGEPTTTADAGGPRIPLISNAGTAFPTRPRSI